MTKAECNTAIATLSPYSAKLGFIVLNCIMWGIMNVMMLLESLVIFMAQIEIAGKLCKA